MRDVIAELTAGLGDDCIRTGNAIPLRNQQDASVSSPTLPLALLLPRSTQEIATALRICHAHGQPVVPQGGLTGLAGGANPGVAEICLSLERMAGVEDIDRDAGTLTALAGTTLAAIQQAADEAGLVCGIDLGARGSCMIGGNVATNAGGNNVLRYGMTRRNVLGLEVVLPDGRIVRSLNKMIKNNAGYDWTQLFVGSEGTLGVITRVVLGLHPKPQGIETALVAVPTLEAAVAILRAAGHALPGGLLAFEAMWRDFLAVAIDKFGLAPPFAEMPPIAILIEAVTDGTEAGRAALEAFLLREIEGGNASDALIAQSITERQRFWAYRETPSEYNRVAAFQIGFDISIPIGHMSDAVARMRNGVKAGWPGMTQVYYGHVADSNLHLIVMSDQLQPAQKDAIEALVYAITADVGGSVSAEHGIGRAKRKYLALTRSDSELDLMRVIKTALDPKDILNRNRIFRSVHDHD